jgi:hypothetical protein
MEVLSEFVEACGEASELFEVSEGAFDSVALAIESAIEAALDFRMDRGGMTAAMPRSLR